MRKVVLSQPSSSTGATGRSAQCGNCAASKRETSAGVMSALFMSGRRLRLGRGAKESGSVPCMVTPRCARASGAAGADAELERAAVARELGDALVEVVGDGAQASRALTWGFSLGSRLRLSLV